MGKKKAMSSGRKQQRRKKVDEGASTSITDDVEFRQVFEKFDSDGDNLISAEELAAILQTLSGDPPSPEELAQMMAEADRDGDGFISFEEFVALITADQSPVDALEDLKQAFSIFDLDGNGVICADELARVLQGLGEQPSADQCRRMIAGVDRDGDGFVNFEEFMEMMSGSAFAAKIRD
ncbi:putative calcium-binding protein CML25 [Wolffia australiana]